MNITNASVLAKHGIMSIHLVVAIDLLNISFVIVSSAEGKKSNVMALSLCAVIVSPWGCHAHTRNQRRRQVAIVTIHVLHDLTATIRSYREGLPRVTLRPLREDCIDWKPF